MPVDARTQGGSITLEQAIGGATSGELTVAFAAVDLEAGAITDYFDYVDGAWLISFYAGLTAGNTFDVDYFTPAQIAYLQSIYAACDIPTISIEDLIAQLTTEQKEGIIQALENAIIDYLTSLQIDSIVLASLSSVSIGDLIAQLTPEQKEGIIQALGPAITDYLSTTQTDAIRTSIIPTITCVEATGLSELTKDCIIQAVPVGDLWAKLTTEQRSYIIDNNC
jgi:hypothetical protein